jgi:predicted LPLAT superfamily acyltransferase
MALDPDMGLTPKKPGAPRNPGPSWGYRALTLMDRVLPEIVFKPLRSGGTWVAVATMPGQRRHSRNYLRHVLGREPGTMDVFRHFLVVSDALMLRLRVAHGTPHVCLFGPGSSDFARWLGSGRPGLLGTFHIGDSDLTGFMLAGQEGKRVHIVRMRVGNSHDIDALAARFGDKLSFIWVNEPGDLLFALKEAGSGNDALALQCDRADYSSRSEEFQFLGARRKFPFTIYHLALIFNRPVLLSFGSPAGPGKSVVHASPAFEPAEGEPRAAALDRARAHFQEFLVRVEEHLRARPYEWLNFLPLT